jgi:hypothetical protein
LAQREIAISALNKPNGGLTSPTNLKREGMMLSQWKLTLQRLGTPNKKRRMLVFAKKGYVTNARRQDISKRTAQNGLKRRTSPLLINQKGELLKLPKKEKGNYPEILRNWLN